jgi:hypothetical protein
MSDYSDSDELRMGGIRVRRDGEAVAIDIHDPGVGVLTIMLPPAQAIVQAGVMLKYALEIKEAANLVAQLVGERKDN